MSNIAIIPARGGSKRIPRKNIQLMAGRPIIARVIDTCLRAKVFDRIIVSTDDMDIARVAQDAGAEIPFERPANLAGDHTPVTAAMTHAANWMQTSGFSADTLTLVYPTAVLMQANDLTRAQAQFAQQQAAEYLVSVTDFPFPIDRALIEDDDGLRFRYPEHRLTRSQDLPECLHDAGQFVFGRFSAWCYEKMLFGPTTVGYKVPRTRVQDIDTPQDWAHAEALLLVLQKSGDELNEQH